MQTESIRNGELPIEYTGDSGFFSEQYLRLFEQKELRYIIPIRMQPPVKRFVASIAETQ
ncbi:MAG: hypothetical protein QOF63_2490, partial [Thermoanaerobaculia bacterium]|nr:hypothetical protein [Thermoanaerobaculia bacterium]